MADVEAVFVIGAPVFAAALLVNNGLSFMLMAVIAGAKHSDSLMVKYLHYVLPSLDLLRELLAKPAGDGARAGIVKGQSDPPGLPKVECNSSP